MSGCCDEVLDRVDGEPDVGAVLGARRREQLDQVDRAVDERLLVRGVRGHRPVGVRPGHRDDPERRGVVDDRAEVDLGLRELHVDRVGRGRGRAGGGGPRPCARRRRRGGCRSGRSPRCRSRCTPLPGQSRGDPSRRAGSVVPGAAGRARRRRGTPAPTAAPRRSPACPLPTASTRCEVAGIPATRQDQRWPSTKSVTRNGSGTPIGGTTMPVLPSWMRPPLWSSRTWLTVGPQRGQFSTSTSSRHTSSGGAASVRDTEKSGDMGSMLPDGRLAAPPRPGWSPCGSPSSWVPPPVLTIAPSGGTPRLGTRDRRGRARHRVRRRARRPDGPARRRGPGGRRRGGRRPAAEPRRARGRRTPA